MKARLNREQYRKAMATAHKWKHLPIKQKLVSIYDYMKPNITSVLFGHYANQNYTPLQMMIDNGCTKPIE